MTSLPDPQLHLLQLQQCSSSRDTTLHWQALLGTLQQANGTDLDLPVWSGLAADLQTLARGWQALQTRALPQGFSLEQPVLHLQLLDVRLEGDQMRGRPHFVLLATVTSETDQFRFRIGVNHLPTLLTSADLARGLRTFDAGSPIPARTQLGEDLLETLDTHPQVFLKIRHSQASEWIEQALHSVIAQVLIRRARLKTAQALATQKQAWIKRRASLHGLAFGFVMFLVLLFLNWNNMSTPQGKVILPTFTLFICLFMWHYTNRAEAGSPTLSATLLVPVRVRGDPKTRALYEAFNAAVTVPVPAKLIQQGEALALALPPALQAARRPEASRVSPLTISQNPHQIALQLKASSREESQRELETLIVRLRDVQTLHPDDPKVKQRVQQMDQQAQALLHALNKEQIQTHRQEVHAELDQLARQLDTADRYISSRQEPSEEDAQTWVLPPRKG